MRVNSQADTETAETERLSASLYSGPKVPQSAWQKKVPISSVVTSERS